MSKQGDLHRPEKPLYIYIYIYIYISVFIYKGQASATALHTSVFIHITSVVKAEDMFLAMSRASRICLIAELVPLFCVYWLCFVTTSSLLAIRKTLLSCGSYL